MPEDEFAKKMATVLSPSHAIDSVELLKGRDAQLSEIRRAWHQIGRQIFIYGYRGVGKTSLAQTAAHQQQSSDQHPIRVICEENGTFTKVVHDIFCRAFPADPRILKQKLDAAVGLKVGTFSAEMRQSIEAGIPPEPKSINEAVLITKFLMSFHSAHPVIIIDEFDMLKNKSEAAKFASYIKELGDSSINVKFIFCGIGEAIDTFFATHESAYRQFHTVKLERLDFDPRLEIIKSASEALNIFIDKTTALRIARVSDGFPHFIHLICEKLFWIIYEDSPDLKVRADHFERAINNAVSVIEPYLKKPYEKATQTYSNDCEEILWAVADDHQLQRPTKEIISSYERIMRTRGKEPLAKNTFYSRMNQMKTEARDSILIGTRSGWYEFREKMMRGYARMRATQERVELDVEHPLQKKKFQREN
ncbi:AAA ATPase-like protein [Nitrospirillum bahiense]|uniref:AAA ATPase-like protein n=1 Tax=Nitrospirillum amazonense TaxID=28077 RepID=A0A560F0R3_9PROT|nr:AAA ATPase-like protein [Nitrospirillum amazonense]